MSVPGDEGEATPDNLPGLGNKVHSLGDSSWLNTASETFGGWAHYNHRVVPLHVFATTGLGALLSIGASRCRGTARRQQIRWLAS